MIETRTLRRILLAGALALPLSGFAGLGAAGAMPAAPLSPALGHDGVVSVQYQRYPNYRYRRFNQGRRAGPYRCGRHGLNTHLERRACR